MANSVRQTAETIPLHSSSSTETPPRVHGPQLRQFLIGFLPTVITLALAVSYAFLFIQDLAPYWFHKNWTTDDSLQQLYPFHKILDPDLFKDDPITKAMEGYLTPLHYAITAFFTRITGDPIMASHWVFLVQLLLTVGFLGAAVFSSAGLIPALVAVTWFLHTRHVVQRLTAGLVRGWAAPVLAAYFYFALKRNHKGMLLTILFGCFVHPPATFLVAGAYGCLLLIELSASETRGQAFRRLITFSLAAPFFAVIAVNVVRMPDEVGTMASYERALAMPEFQSPGGRFPFVPLLSIGEEFHTFAFQAFLSKWVKLGRIGGKEGLPFDFLLIGAVVAFTAWLLVLQRRTKQVFLPTALVAYLIAVGSTYELSRLLAFRLYVPNRHLQIPMAMFFIVGLSIGGWRFGQWSWRKLGFSPSMRAWGGSLILGTLAIFVGIGSGHGLDSRANFNWQRFQRGQVFEWIRTHTAKDALIAGHPTFIDPVQLFAERRGFATTETAHPFYDKYYALVAPRLELSLRAHFSRDLDELYGLLAPAGIDYFVFERARFYPEALKEQSYFLPMDTLVQSLTTRPWNEYAYRSLPSTVDAIKAPYMPYRDAYSALIDVKALGEYLAHQKKLLNNSVTTQYYSTR